MASKTRYAIIGVGSRAGFFYSAIARDYAATAEIAALCDTNQTRMDLANRRLVDEFGYAAPVPTYKALSQFDKMVEEARPDVVIVTSVDRTHDVYIVRALELGRRVITEKPMTVDAPRCARILRCVADTGGELRVAFNYRYAPVASRVHELLRRERAIGAVTSVHFEWLLNTRHGADYFRRWHRDRRNSGGLLVHKATHHFDLVNFWLGTRPRTVYARGGLRFYGRENAEARGVERFYARGTGEGGGAAAGDPFALDLAGNAKLKALYLDAEHEDGYLRDQSVFGDGISIEDTMNVMVTYDNGAVMTYSLTAYAPWEGYRIGFNGTGGRLEVEVVENSYVSAGGAQEVEGSLRSRKILLRRHFEKPVEVEVPEARGGHGGGDVALLNDLFGEKKSEHAHKAAGHVDGAMSIMTGIAANQSIATDLPVNIDDLLAIR
jgi:predicted dehydrogenase